jgi:hypothetical protein
VGRRGLPWPRAHAADLPARLAGPAPEGDGFARARSRRSSSWR